jgi:hypothetical protein
MTVPSPDTHAAQEGKMGEWISVKKRLPKGKPYAEHPEITEWPRVLIYAPRYPDQIVGQYIGALKEWRFDGSPTNFTREVTHWQYRPSPPAQEAAKK